MLIRELRGGDGTSEVCRPMRVRRRRLPVGRRWKKANTSVSSAAIELSASTMASSPVTGNLIAITSLAIDLYE